MGIPLRSGRLQVRAPAMSLLGLKIFDSAVDRNMPGINTTVQGLVDSINACIAMAIPVWKHVNLSMQHQPELSGKVYRSDRNSVECTVQPRVELYCAAQCRMYHAASCQMYVAAQS